MTSLIGIQILLLVVFFIVWLFARRDLALLGKQARPPAGDELGKVRENIEQLLDVLEEKSTTAERNLRQLIDEAKGAARQIEQATAMAVKSLEAATPPQAMPPQNGAANLAAERVSPSNGAAMRPAPSPSNGTSARHEEASASPNGTAVRQVEAPAPPPIAPARTPHEPEAAGTAPIAMQETAPQAARPEPPTPLGLNPVATDADPPLMGASMEKVELDAPFTSPAAVGQPDSPRAPSINMMPAAEAMNDMPSIDDVFTPWPAPSRPAEPPEETEEPSGAWLPEDGPKNAPAEESVADQSPAGDGEMEFRPFAITAQAVTNPFGDTDVPAPDAAPRSAPPGQEETYSARRDAGEPAGMTNGSRGEATRQTVALAESARSEATKPERKVKAAEKEEAAPPVSAPGSDRFSEVYALAQQGVTDVSEIARQTGLGRTEVEMVLSLWRRQ